MAAYRASFRRAFAGLLAGFSLLLVASPAGAVPAFARKYGTSCLTCHTVFPKLNPFGEAFRRNGFRFPGVDSDSVKEKTIRLSPEVAKKQFPRMVWPSTLPASVPLAFGVTGNARIHPDRNSGGALADDRAVLTLQDLAEEAQIWAAGSFTDSTTFFAELAASEDEVELEHGYVLFNDLVGPKYAVNLIAGKTMPRLSTFGAHSSYLVDTALPSLPVTALYGAQSDSWSAVSPTGLVEVNGVLGGRFDYSAGLSGGVNADIRTSESVYAHIGGKLGGMPLAGGSTAASAKPWEENAITGDLFFFREASHFDNALGDLQKETALAFGGALRFQWRSLELDAGSWVEDHDDAQAGGGDVTALTYYNELSYIVWPWLVPAVRLQYTRLDPGGPAPTVSDLRIIPGVSALVFANLKVVTDVQIERGNGAPPGGWEPVGGMALPPLDETDTEVEVVQVMLQYAF